MRQNTMPAAQLHVLLWHYFTPSPYPHPSGCHQEFVDALMHLQLMDHDRERPNMHDEQYELTERGRFYVDRILELPLPISKWVMP